MRRPKGVKTKKSVAKRFKITARGKVLRPRAGRRHLLQTKNPKRRRVLGKNLESQRLLMPATVKADAGRQALPLLRKGETVTKASYSLRTRFSKRL